MLNRSFLTRLLISLSLFVTNVSVNTAAVAKTVEVLPSSLTNSEQLVAVRPRVTKDGKIVGCTHPPKSGKKR